MKDHMIGIDVGGTNSRVALLNRNLEIVSKEAALTSDFDTADVFFKKLREMVYRVDPDHRAEAIGIVLPAPWTIGKKTITDATNVPFLEDFEIKKIKYYFEGYQVYLENDVNVIALLESNYGAAKNSIHSVYITVSTGIGSGIIINNKIYHGANGYAGEIGSILVGEQDGISNDPLDYTLERLCSGKALESRSIAIYGETAAAVDLFVNYRDGESRAKEVLRVWISNLSSGLAAVTQMMDPDVIVLGGPVILNHKWIMEQLKEEIRKKVLGRLAEKVKIAAAEFDAESGLIGAAYYAFEANEGRIRV
ncbi:glucokinase [Anaerotaenia torta]|uniref:ROK family protein n=1 Tax=Anaerotaenia torta TaxID=433293 RepID=UPI003D213C76